MATCNAKPGQKKLCNTRAINPRSFYLYYQDSIDSAAQRIGVPAHWLMCVMHHETGARFLTDIESSIGAVGLIQFTPYVAKGVLGTTTARLKAMTVPEQLEQVVRFFAQPNTRGPYKDVSELYCCIFAPKYRKYSDNTPMYRAPSAAYSANKSLDAAQKGYISRGDIVSKINALYEKYYRNGMEVVSVGYSANQTPPDDEITEADQFHQPEAFNWLKWLGISAILIGFALLIYLVFNKKEEK